VTHAKIFLSRCLRDCRSHHFVRAVQYLVVHTIPDAGASKAPAVESARRFLGPIGVRLVTAGTLVSAYGYLSANMLHTPRITFAMGQREIFRHFSEGSTRAFARRIFQS